MKQNVQKINNVVGGYAQQRKKWYQLNPEIQYYYDIYNNKNGRYLCTARSLEEAKILEKCMNGISSDGKMLLLHEDGSAEFIANDAKTSIFSKG